MPYDYAGAADSLVEEAGSLLITVIEQGPPYTNDQILAMAAVNAQMAIARAILALNTKVKVE